MPVCLASPAGGEIPSRQGFPSPLGCSYKQCALKIYSLSHVTEPWGNSRMNWSSQPKIRPWACHSSTSILLVALHCPQYNSELLPMRTSLSHLSHLALLHTPCVLALQHVVSLMKHAYAYLWAFACAIHTNWNSLILPYSFPSHG